VQGQHEIKNAESLSGAEERMNLTVVKAEASTIYREGLLPSVGGKR